jgi:predicted acylesterase/phospholipase RssA
MPFTSGMMTVRRRQIIRIWRLVAGLCLGLAVAGCTQLLDAPLNPAVSQATQFSPDYIPDADGDGSLVIGLAFSGGGTRAAAYSYGILQQLHGMPVPGDRNGRHLDDAVRMVSGASGGAITATYFGLKGPNGFADLRQRFLDRNGEQNLHTAVLWPPNVVGALAGGINNRSTFAKWLDDNVYQGARFKGLRRPGGPIVWINASDIWNKTPFLFSYDTFASLCSNLDELPISEAVAASAAVPIIFAPVVIKTYGPRCGYKRPAWLQKALDDPDTSMRVRAFAMALENYQNINRLKFVKLLDGGLTDNFGLTGFAINRAASTTPYGPLSPRAAVRLKTLLYLVADAGRQEDIGWGETLQGPSLPDLIPAMADTMIDSSVRNEFDAMRLALNDWRNGLISYRCSLPAAEVQRYRGTLAGWDCRDVSLFFDDVSFHDLDAATQVKLRSVETRLVLPPDQVNLTIEAGRQALLRNNGFRGALANMAHGKMDLSQK